MEAITVREVIIAYRKKALKVHPDKLDHQASAEERANATAEFQELNSSYQNILSLVIDRLKQKNDDGNGVDQKNEDDDVTVDERFMKDNFEHCNFPHENDGSFTVIIQHHQADSWQECLEEVYGQPEVIKSTRGTVSDCFWKFQYEYEGNKMNLTLHIYNKPRNRKSSKLMIQGGN